MAYFSGQGRVYIGERDALGNPKGLRFVGNVPELKISLDVETVEHKESQSGQRLTDLSYVKSKKGEFSCTLEEFLMDNLSLSLFGKVVKQTTGTATDEVLPTADVGHLIALARQNVSSVVVKDSTGSPKTLPSTQYLVNDKYGSIIINDKTTGGPYVEPFKASYTYGASKSVPMFTSPLPERWVRFEGLNTVDGNAPVLIELYRVAISPTKELSVITDELAKFELSGQALADTLKSESSDLGQFGRIVML